MLFLAVGSSKATEGRDAVRMLAVDTFSQACSVYSSLVLLYSAAKQQATDHLTTVERRLTSRRQGLLSVLPRAVPHLLSFVTQDRSIGLPFL